MDSVVPSETPNQQHPRDPADHRKEPRQPVDTRAVLHLIPSGTDMPGRIADLSPSGCRLCTDAPFPLGVYRRVEIEFRLQGLPLRIAGVTQAIYGRCSIGVRFLDVSPRKRDQLDQLIAEIKDALTPTADCPCDAEHSPALNSAAKP